MCDLLDRHVAGERAQLATDEVLKAATQRWIEIIGEAAANVSDGLREAHPEIPWRNIIGMRNVLIHAYPNVDVEKLWDVIDRWLPDLVPKLRLLVAELE